MKSLWRAAAGLVAAGALTACAHHHGHRYRHDHSDDRHRVRYERECADEHRHRLACGHRVACHSLDGRHHYEHHRCGRGDYADGCRRD